MPVSNCGNYTRQFKLDDLLGYFALPGGGEDSHVWVKVSTALFGVLGIAALGLLYRERDRLHQVALDPHQRRHRSESGVWDMRFLLWSILATVFFAV